MADRTADAEIYRNIAGASRHCVYLARRGALSGAWDSRRVIFHSVLSIRDVEMMAAVEAIVSFKAGGASIGTLAYQIAQRRAIDVASRYGTKKESGRNGKLVMSRDLPFAGPLGPLVHGRPRVRCPRGIKPSKVLEMARRRFSGAGWKEIAFEFGVSRHKARRIVESVKKFQSEIMELN